MVVDFSVANKSTNAGDCGGCASHSCGGGR